MAQGERRLRVDLQQKVRKGWEEKKPSEQSRIASEDYYAEVIRGVYRREGDDFRDQHVCGAAEICA
jgi:hypothetical protein